MRITHLFILSLYLLTIAADEVVEPPEVNEPAPDSLESPNSDSLTETLKEDKVELPKPGTNAESYAFSADVSKILDILIHSLYSNKEIFLRELISNASDALDKLRQLIFSSSIEDKSKETLKIRILADKEASTLTIIDNGVGMTKDELRDNLGTIARSGTTSFLEALEGGMETSLIGQFGVGFYSVYLVSDSVVVSSKSPYSDAQYRWISTADQSFYIEEDLEGDKIERGTRITLYLKQDSKELLETEKLAKILKHHSQFISYPIYLQVEKEKEVEESGDDGEDDLEADGETEEEQKDQEEEEEEPAEPEAKTKKKEKYLEDELINSLKPLWMRPTNEIKEEEYFEFFKAHTKTSSNPEAYIHFSAEGEIDFKAILFIPSSASQDPYSDYGRKEGVISLYVKRVLITNEFKDLLPQYLGFIRGIVDSDSLPLNVNREMLQQSRIFSVIGKKLTRKAISMFQNLANKHKKTEENKEEQAEEPTVEKSNEVDNDNDDYKKFYKNFGRFLKVGVTEDKNNRVRLAKLLRFPSTLHPSNMTSLQSYVSRMKDGQKFMYYLAGESIEAIQNHPTLEKLTSLGYEILLLTDSLDEHCLQSLGEFEGMKITDTSRETLKVDEQEEEKKRLKAIKKMYEPLTKWYGNVLGSEVEKVVMSKRLVSSPAAVVVGDFGWTANMERVMKSQIFSSAETFGYMKPHKTLELNPGHPIVKNLLERVTSLDQQGEEDDQESNAQLESLKNYAKLLYQSTLIMSGFSLPPSESTNFMSRIDHLLREGLKIPLDDVVEEIDIDDLPVEQTEVKDEGPTDEPDDMGKLPEDFDILKNFEKFGKDEL